MSSKPISLPDLEPVIGPPGWRLTFLGVLAVVFVVALAAQIVGLDWRSWFCIAKGESFTGSVRNAAYTLMAHFS